MSIYHKHTDKHKISWWDESAGKNLYLNSESLPGKTKNILKDNLREFYCYKLKSKRHWIYI
jgi:hypothetical protein